MDLLRYVHMLGGGLEVGEEAVVEVVQVSKTQRIFRRSFRQVYHSRRVGLVE